MDLQFGGALKWASSCLSTRPPQNFFVLALSLRIRVASAWSVALDRIYSRSRRSDFLQNRVSRDTECSNRMAVTGSDGCRGRVNRSVQSDWLRCVRGRLRPTISHVSGNSKAPLNWSTPRASCTTPLKCAALVAHQFSARPTPQFFCYT